MVNVNPCGCGLHGHETRRAWISVAQAAALMGLSKRQALRRLARRNVELGGRLLRQLGEQRRQGRSQPSKFLVSTEVFLQSMRPEQANAERDIEHLRIELAVMGQKLAALRATVRQLRSNSEP